MLLAPCVRDRQVAAAKRGRASSLTSKSQPEIRQNQLSCKLRLKYVSFLQTRMYDTTLKNFDFQTHLTLMDEFTFNVYSCQSNAYVT
jgi:hypothetical protein